MDRVVRTLLTFRVQARTSGWRASPPFGTPQTMAVRPVTEIQNRLFWRTGTGRASQCWVPVHDVSQRILRLGSDASAEQRLEGADDRCAAVDRLVLITATSPGQHTGGKCLIGATGGSADGFDRPDRSRALTLANVTGVTANMRTYLARSGFPEPIANVGRVCPTRVSRLGVSA